MSIIARNGRWILEVSYDEEVTINTTWSDAGTYYIRDSTTGRVFKTYYWSINEMCERHGPVSISFTEEGKAILLKFHDGSMQVEALPGE
jgi:hypothetical protein